MACRKILVSGRRKHQMCGKKISKKCLHKITCTNHLKWADIILNIRREVTCKKILSRGRRCKRKVGSNNFCYQHKPDEKIIIQSDIIAPDNTTSLINIRQEVTCKKQLYSGRRCKRKVGSNNFCYQHRPDEKIIIQSDIIAPDITSLINIRREVTCKKMLTNIRRCKRKVGSNNFCYQHRPDEKKSTSIAIIIPPVTTVYRIPNKNNVTISKQKFMFKFYADLYNGIDHTCSICLDCIGIKDVSIQSCGHLYHPQCINEWKLVTKTCPICRSNI
jgi:hypothetical protein